MVYQLRKHTFLPAWQQGEAPARFWLQISSGLMPALAVLPRDEEMSGFARKSITFPFPTILWSHGLFRLLFLSYLSLPKLSSWVGYRSGQPQSIKYPYCSSANIWELSTPHCASEKHPLISQRGSFVSHWHLLVVSSPSLILSL